MILNLEENYENVYLLQDKESFTIDNAYQIWFVFAAIKQIQVGENVKYSAVEIVKRDFQVAKNTEFQSKVVKIDCQNVARLVNNKQGSKSEILWIISKVTIKIFNM